LRTVLVSGTRVPVWRGLSIVIALAVFRTALAQPPAPGEPPGELPAAAFFEQRVTERLASEGVVLSRRHLGLRIEHGEGGWQVSLIDLASGQPAAAVELGQLPPDRDAAVELVVRAAADLARHLVTQLAKLESEFNPRSLRFAATYRLDAQGVSSASRRWVAFQGAVDQQLDPAQFYRIVGRDDLVAAYERRRYFMIGSYIAAGLSIGIGLGLMITAEPDFRPCAPLPPVQRAACDSDQEPSIVPGLVGAGVSLGAALLGTYLYRNPHPIDESEAKLLADSYNRQLLHQLGGPGVARRPVLRDVKLVPYVARGDIGLALGARF
jgi:hypothetical protein